MRVVFMGTPYFAVPTLTAITGQGFEIVSCYTQPPRPAGRKMALQMSPVHKTAEALGIPVRTPTDFKGKIEKRDFIELKADVAVVVAYGILLPRAVLEAVKYGCLNVHASLLPRWRGAAPINRAIMAGDRETGVEVMRMEETLDTGPICMKRKVPISPDMTAGELHDVLAELGSELMIETLANLQKGGIEEETQSESGITYARKITNSETRIDWNLDSAEVHNRIRGLSPIPGAWCEIEISGKPERIKVLGSQESNLAGKTGQIIDGNLTVACGKGSIRILKLQRAGKKPMSSDEFLRGVKLPIGTTVF